MADFSMTTLFVVPVSQTTLPSTGSTQDLTAGQLGIFTNAYVATATPQTSPYFYIAQGRENTYLLGSKRSDKIKGCAASYPCNSNVTEWYKVSGCPTPVNQITDIDGWSVQCGEDVTLTLRAHSSYIDTLYFNGFTRSVTVQAPCCECGGDPCTDVDVDALIDAFIVKLEEVAPDFMGGDTTGTNPDNISLSTFFNFERVGSGTDAILRIHGKALTAYGVPCDVAAFPFEYDRMWFKAFVYSGPATTVDFIVSDACNIVAEATDIQKSNYAKGTSAEIKQMEKNYYSYQAGIMKHLYRLMGYNQNLESYVTDGENYTTFYIKINEFGTNYNWGDYVPQDSLIIIACVTDSAIETAIENALEAALGTVVDDTVCVTTTTTTAAPTTTTTTTVSQG